MNNRVTSEAAAKAARRRNSKAAQGKGDFARSSPRTSQPASKNSFTTAPMMSTARRLLADIRELAPHITARAAEIEAGRRIPEDLVGTLRSIGVFRLFVPQSHGGIELDLPTALETITALAKIEGSVGWTVAIGSGCDIFAALLPRDTYEQVYSNGPNVIIAGSAQPAGTAEIASGGWRVNGRWPFASGCQHADWMFGLCVMTKGGKPLTGEGGPPMVRGFFLPARDWQIEDTWYVAGLKGTGSHHITLRDTIVPAANFFDLGSGVPCLPGPLYQTVSQFLPLLHGAICVGIAEGAVDELIALANTGRHQLGGPVPMRQSETFQGELGRVAADLRAARAFLQVQAASHWGHAVVGTRKDEALVMQAKQTATWVAAACVRVADVCFALGGGSALYETSPLQRRLRDMHAAAQHAIAHQRNYVSAGNLLLLNQPLCRELETNRSQEPSPLEAII
jgi:indole-3-acetate monooxygenase